MSASIIRLSRLSSLIGKILSCVVVRAIGVPEGGPTSLAERYRSAQKLLREAQQIMDGERKETDKLWRFAKTLLKEQGRMVFDKNKLCWVRPASSPAGGRP